jgi:hypothetical protein
MGTNVQVKPQAKTRAALSPAGTVRLLQVEPERQAELEASLPDLAAQMDRAARLGHNLGAISVSNAVPIIQRQMPPQEDEEEELQMQREPAALQRQQIAEEEEEELQRQAVPEEEEELQMKRDDQRVGVEGGKVLPAVESAINRARGVGQPLDSAVQTQMGERLGHDFSAVRVHTDAQAHALNEQLSAKAFTTGRDIFFRQGEYDLASSSGRELIGHELAHVVQQSTGRVRGDGSGMTVRPAGDAFEKEADSQAKRTATLDRRGVFPQAGSLKAERRMGSSNAFLGGSASPIQRNGQDLALLSVPVDFLYVVKRNRLWLKSPDTILNEANRILAPKAGIVLTLGSDNQILVEEIIASVNEKVAGLGVPYASKADAFDMVVREKAQSMRPTGKISLFVFNMDFPGVPGVRGKSYHAGSTFPIHTIQEAFAQFIQESNWRGVATVYYPAAGRIGETVAHEVGHVLLGSGKHHDNPGNLMADATVRSGTNLEHGQVDLIRAAAQ